MARCPLAEDAGGTGDNIEWRCSLSAAPCDANFMCQQKCWRFQTHRAECAEAALAAVNEKLEQTRVRGGCLTWGRAGGPGIPEASARR